MGRWERGFGPESTFYEVLTQAADLVVLNVAFIVSSLPVITVGPGARAALAGCADVAEDRGSRRLGPFVKRLMTRWRPAAAAGLTVLVAVLLAGAEILVIGSKDTGIVGAAMCGLALAGAAGALVIATWVLAVSVARGGEEWRVGAYLALSHPLSSLAIAAVWGVPVGCFLLLPALRGFLLAFYLIIGFAVSFYLIWLACRRPLLRSSEEG